MQGAVARVCVVVAAAILNHPLLFPRENTTLLEQDEELLARMRDHEERLEREQARLEKELSEADAQQRDTGSEDPGSEDTGYSCYFWSALSLVIFLTIEVCRQDLAEMQARYLEDEDTYAETGSISSRTLVLDKAVLGSFCHRCIHTSAHENWRVREFAEGFADDLLEALRSVCDREADMEVGDFVGVGSMFESWRVSKPSTCDLLVPFTPPEPYSFQYQLWCGAPGVIPPDMQGCGRIQVVRGGEGERGCLCGSDLEEDMLCLLHGRNEKPGADRTPDELLCSKNTPYLAKDQVMKWFQISVTKAWGRISHKYEFELTFRNLDAAGALKVRFRSGKVVVMNIIPVVQLEDTDAYFVPHFPSDVDAGSSDTYWALSFAVYERDLLKRVAKGLPEHACHLHCLQIVTFVHAKQTRLTGRSALTNYHLKTALLHLLLNRDSACWVAASLELRIRDVLGLLQRSLQEKTLHHVLVGNSQVPVEIGIPEMFRTSEPINLFRPLVLEKELYEHTVRHFQEMLKNAPVLIQEYTPLLANGDALYGLDSSS